MIKKLTNKQLALILFVLLVVFGITKYIRDKRGENTFHTALIPKIDSAKINGMLIFPKGKGPDRVITFKNDGKLWMVSQLGINSRADQKAEGYVIQQLKQVSPDRLAANDPSEWKNFDVSDTAGTRVVLLHDKDTVVDVMVGRFSYLPAERKGMTYVRLRNQKEVYGVEGFLAMNIASDFYSWRDRRLVVGDHTNWSKIIFNYPDSSYIVSNDSSNRWTVDGKKPDSLATANLLNQFSQQNYGTFADKFDTNKRPPAFSIMVEGSQGNFILKAYPNDSANSYIVTSTINPGAKMNGNNNNLFKNLFLPKKAFFHHPESAKVAPAAQKKGKK